MTAPLGATYVVARVDNAHFNVNSLNQQGAYANSIGVIFQTPEPGAGVAMVGAAAVTLLGRKSSRGRGTKGLNR